LFIGSRDIFKILITDQPKGRPGLIYKAEEGGKGKEQNLQPQNNL